MTSARAGKLIWIETTNPRKLVKSQMIKNKTTNCVFSNESHPIMAPQNVILGASNCTRLIFENLNAHNISVSGTSLDKVQKMLDKSDSQVDSEHVDSVVLSLDTNDVAQYKNDTEQIIVNVTTCVENVKHKYPNANTGVCSILPRRGKRYTHPSIKLCSIVC